jgi:hypothetical protein
MWHWSPWRGNHLKRKATASSNCYVNGDGRVWLKEEKRLTSGLWTQVARKQQKGKAMSEGSLCAEEQDKMTGVTIVVISNSM